MIKSQKWLVETKKKADCSAFSGLFVKAGSESLVVLLHVAEEVLAGYRGQVVHRNVSVKKSLHFGYLILKL